VNLENSLEETLARLDQKGLRRSLCSTRNLGQGQLALRGQQALNLAGNDYLGLASNVALLQEFYAGLTEEKALIFNSGWHLACASSCRNSDC
jgi:8-amino-7-oxononanoate synthase